MVGLISRIDWFKALLYLLTTFLAVCGIGAQYFSPRRNKFYHSSLILFYAIVVSGAFAFIYLREVYATYLDGFQLNHVSQLYSTMNIINAILSYGTALYFHREMTLYMNRAKISETIRFFGVTQKMVNKPLILVFLRAVLFPLATEIALIMNKMRFEPERSIAGTFFLLFPAIIAQVIPNYVFGVFELWKVYVRALNCSLATIRNEVNYIQRVEQMKLQKPYYRMQRFCELSDRLEALAEKYYFVGYLGVTFLQMYSVPYVCAIICNLIGITIGCYIQYYAIANTLINGDNFDVFNMATNGMFLIISIGEIAFLANLSNENLVATRETARILQSMTTVHTDVRFQQSVEFFFLVAHTNQFKIKPLGLFEVNIALIHDMSGAITSFLLILIQSDLSLRFSLK